VVAAARPAAGVLWAVPSLVGVGVGVLLLRRLVRELRPRDRTPLVGLRSGSQDAPDRRTFLLLAGLTAAGAVVALGASRAVSAGSRAVDAVRRAIRLPAAAKAAPAVPAGAELGIDGLDPYVTPNESFYRIDTALRVPQVAPDDWSLTVTGLVDEPVTITWDDLHAAPLEGQFVTRACVSNRVGGDLFGNALWLGHPVRERLAPA